MVFQTTLPLQSSTDLAWTQVVLSNFDYFLQDHASCERKAAALAMSFVTKYPDRKAMIEPMVSLAREELEHFAQVFRVLQARGIELGEKDEKDLYVNAILSELRHGRDERFLDRLMMSALIEARGHERFGLLASVLVDEKLKKFYEDLSKREAGHYKIFVNIAKIYFRPSQVEEALTRLAALEARALAQVPWRPALH